METSKVGPSETFRLMNGTLRRLVVGNPESPRSGKGASSGAPFSFSCTSWCGAGNLLAVSSNPYEAANSARLKGYTVSATKFRAAVLRIAEIRGMSREDIVTCVPVEHRKKLRRLLKASYAADQKMVEKRWVEMVVRRVAGASYVPTPSEAAALHTKNRTLAQAENSA